MKEDVAVKVYIQVEVEALLLCWIENALYISFYEFVKCG